MKVILRSAVPDLGETGQVVQVKDGYARNFLIPQGLAQPATGRSLAHVARLKSAREKRKDQLQRTAEDLREKIAAVTLTIAKRTGEADRLFGTVTTAEIAAALAAQGLKVDRRIIHISDPIKGLGSYTVDVRLHAQVHAPLKVEVVRQ